MNSKNNDRYILHCLLPPEIVQFHRNLVNEIAEETGLRLTQLQGLSAHFTLKYYFRTSDIQPVESAIEAFCRTAKSAPVRLEGLGNFNENVLFFDVQLSEEAKITFLGLNETLAAFKWMQWDQYDRGNIHFHMTIAEECGDKFESAFRIASARNRSFDVALDNITILRETEVRDGIDYWEIYKKLPIRNQ